MEVIERELDGVPIISINGEISLYDLDLITKAISVINSKGYYSYIVDLKEVSFMDSSGIGVFMRAIAAASKKNGVLYFANCNKRIENLLHISLGNTTSQIFDSEKNAVAELKRNEVKKS